MSCNVKASPECAARYYETAGNFDVRPLLPRVGTPTLVMHVRDDAMVPIQLGRELAGIPGARFVALAGQNHNLLDQEPGVPKFFEEVRRFLKGS
jgi:pimeloyl-ACP methyl ester carboxylesterase